MLKSLVLAAAIVAPPAIAAEEDAWAFANRDSGRTAIASVAYDTGIRVIVQCQAGGLDVMVTGLPQGDSVDPSRPVRLTFEGPAYETGVWLSLAEGGVVVSGLPGSLARRLRMGGAAQLRVNGASNGPDRVYPLDLPPSPSAIGQVLQTCDEPSHDERDGRAHDYRPDTDSFEFVRRPRPEYPAVAFSEDIDRGWATVSCEVTATGQMAGCRVEAEAPRGYGFGVSAVRAARAATVRNVERLFLENPRPVIVFPVSFALL